ncbi:MAG: hypothetical protein ACREKQ_04945 [Candidatus Rokuibacteriota bacterium]
MQKQAGGRVTPETWTHGSARQRVGLAPARPRVGQGGGLRHVPHRAAGGRGPSVAALPLSGSGRPGRCGKLAARWRSFSTSEVFAPNSTPGREWSARWTGCPGASGRARRWPSSGSRAAASR